MEQITAIQQEKKINDISKKYGLPEDIIKIVLKKVGIKIIKKPKRINLRYAFNFMDNPELVKNKYFQKRLRRLGRCGGSTQEELNDMSCYGK